jgi:uncharacterized DUF497 family protein
MRIKWDERKRTTNLRQHGLDFVDVEEIFKDETLTIIDDRFDYDEIRYVSFGMLHAMVVAIVYTETDETIRIISLRKATRNEEREYYTKIRD